MVTGVRPDAINAYQKAAQLQGAPSLNTEKATSDTGFSSLVSGVLGDVSTKVSRVEQNALGTITGKASVEDLAISVTEAETTLRTVVAVRDRMINAYQDIIKMPI